MSGEETDGGSGGRAPEAGEGPGIAPLPATRSSRAPHAVFFGLATAIASFV